MGDGSKTALRSVIPEDRKAVVASVRHVDKSPGRMHGHFGPEVLAPKL